MPGPYPLPTLAASITEFGIFAPTYEDILASLQASYQQIYGSDVDLAPDTQDGQWVAVHAQAVYDFNQSLIAGYLSYSPSFAIGVGLSSVVKINGIARLVPSNSTVELLLVGQAGTEIINGAAADAFQQVWNLPPDVIINFTGAVTVTATAANTGAVTAEPNTVTTIMTPVPGWQTVTNLQAASPGFPVETDATLRMRQTRSTALPSITPMEGIDGAIASVAGVGRSKVYQNDTPFLDEDNLPPHSIAVVVEGGDAQAIAQVILEKKNVGAGTYGSTQEIVTDSRGVPLAVAFFYLTEINVFVTVTINPLLGYASTTGDLVVASIVQYINSLDIGEDVYYTRLFTPANLQAEAAMAATGFSQPYLDGLSNTYVVTGITLGAGPSPTGINDVVIPFNCAATCVTANVLIALARPQGSAAGYGFAIGHGSAVSPASRSPGHAVGAGSASAVGVRGPRGRATGTGSAHAVGTYH